MNPRFEAVTKTKIHHLFNRKLAQFDTFVEKILDSYERNELFYLYTDFCPIKNTLNLDDINRFLLLKWLQQVFKVPLIIHIKDNHTLIRDELNISNAGDPKEIKEIITKKYSIHRDLNAKQMKALQNSIADKQGLVKEQFRISISELMSECCIKDIISLGLDMNRTFICRHMQHLGNEQSYVKCVIRAGSMITLGTALQFYNLTNSDSIQAMSLAAKDVAALFSASYPRIFNDTINIRCLVVPGTSPFVNRSPSILALSVAPLLGYPSPSTIELQSVPSLCGKASMSATSPMTCIYLSDSDKSIKDKINKVAFSGGRDSVEEHRSLGGNCDVDVSYQYLRHFMADDEQLESIRARYSSGEMLTGELKKVAIDLLSSIIGEARERRLSIGGETVAEYMRPRLLGGDDLSVAMGPVVVDEIVELPIAEAVQEEEKEVDNGDDSEDVVTPWEVLGDVDTGIDYDKLIDRYGSAKITAQLVDRFEAVTGKKAHHLLRRGVFYSHREFNEIIDAFEKRQKFFLYTGRGPSSQALHLGHLVPFLFTQWLQEVFGVPLVVQLTDDEKFLMRGIDIDEVQRLAIENAKDIIAIGFDETRTFVFRDLEYLGQSDGAFYSTALRVGAKVTFNQVRGIFGFGASDSVEKIVFPATQAAPSFACSFPEMLGNSVASTMRSLIPCAIDQDPYFRMTRDVAPRLDMPKPALIHSRFFPALQGPRTKMNASDPNSAIFMTDSRSMIVDKVRNHAAALTTEMKAGLSEADVCLRDTCYQYLTFFMEDDERLEEVRRALVEDRISAEELKEELIVVLVPIVERHAEARMAVTDDVVKRFMTPRPLQF